MNKLNQLFSSLNQDEENEVNFLNSGLSEKLFGGNWGANGDCGNNGCSGTTNSSCQNTVCASSNTNTTCSNNACNTE